MSEPTTPPVQAHPADRPSVGRALEEIAGVINRGVPAKEISQAAAEALAGRVLQAWDAYRAVLDVLERVIAQRDELEATVAMMTRERLAGPTRPGLPHHTMN